MSGTNWPLYASLGASAYLYWQGSQGKLPANLQAIYTQIFGAATGSSSPAAPPSPGGSGVGPSAACSASAVTTWAVPGGGPKGILGDSAPYNLSIAIGSAFCATNGHMPASMDEFNTWGVSSGHKHADGGWS
jgi:hypothetical protein